MGKRPLNVPLGQMSRFPAIIALPQLMDMVGSDGGVLSTSLALGTREKGNKVFGSTRDT